MKDILEIIQRSSNHSLDRIIRTGAPGMALAIEELNGRALGGNPGAQERVRRLDNDIHPAPVPDQGARLSRFLPVRPKREARIARFSPPDRDPSD